MNAVKNLFTFVHKADSAKVKQVEAYTPKQAYNALKAIVTNHKDFKLKTT